MTSQSYARRHRRHQLDIKKCNRYLVMFFFVVGWGDFDKQYLTKINAWKIHWCVFGTYTYSENSCLRSAGKPHLLIQISGQACLANLISESSLCCHKIYIYRMFIKYCVFSLKCCDFSELCQFCCSYGVLPAIRRSTHTLTLRQNRERPESGICFII